MKKLPDEIVVTREQTGGGVMDDYDENWLVAYETPNKVAQFDGPVKAGVYRLVKEITVTTKVEISTRKTIKVRKKK